MRRMKRYQLASYECLIIKYAKDERYELNGIATHDKYVHFALVLFNLVHIRCQCFTSMVCIDVLSHEGVLFV